MQFFPAWFLDEWWLYSSDMQRTPLLLDCAASSVMVISGYLKVSADILQLYCITILMRCGIFYFELINIQFIIAKK